MADHVPYVSEDDCIACGACEEICPEVFTVNDSLGFAQVMNPSGAPADKIQEAIDACPVQCIHWANGTYELGGIGPRIDGRGLDKLSVNRHKGISHEQIHASHRYDPSLL